MHNDLGSGALSVPSPLISTGPRSPVHEFVLVPGNIITVDPVVGVPGYDTLRAQVGWHTKSSRASDVHHVLAG